MKTIRYLLLLASVSLAATSCHLFHSAKRGCPAGGVGAEQYLDGSKTPKAKKFRS